MKKNLLTGSATSWNKRTIVLFHIPRIETSNRNVPAITINFATSTPRGAFLRENRASPRHTLANKFAIRIPRRDPGGGWDIKSIRRHKNSAFHRKPSNRVVRTSPCATSNDSKRPKNSSLRSQTRLFHMNFNKPASASRRSRYRAEYLDQRAASVRLAIFPANTRVDSSNPKAAKARTHPRFPGFNNSSAAG